MNYFESKRLREERGEVVSQMQAIAKVAREENRPFTGEEIQRYDNLDNSQKELQVKIESAERVERADTLVITPNITSEYKPVSTRVVTKKDHELALRGWALRQAGFDHLVTAEMNSGAERVGINPTHSNFQVHIQRDTLDQITTPVNATNGALVQGLEESLLSWGQMLNACQVVKTADGRGIKWATEDDTGVVASAHDLSHTISSTGVTFGTVALGAFSCASAVYPVALEVLQDVSIDLSAVLGNNIGTRLGRKLNQWWTYGAGTTEPTGLAVGVTPTFFYTHDSDIDWYNVLVNLTHNVDVGYRSSPKFGYMFSDEMLGVMRLLVDDVGRPLWQTNLQVGEPDRLLGKPYWINNDLGDHDATDYASIICGDFNKFVIRMVEPISLVVLRERFAEAGAVGFVGLARSDSACINTGAFKAARAADGSSVNCG